MKPRKINKAHTEYLLQKLELAGIQIPKGYEIYATDTVRGRCSYRSMNITVPLWATGLADYARDAHNDDVNFCIYYACHEIAHVMTGYIKGAPHGAKFMSNFKAICPQHLWHFEIGYKPRNAAAAGIRSKK